MTNELRFFLNGEPVTLVDPDPNLLLIDFLRSPEVGLTGAKKGCGQGGCGACTVILSQWDPKTQTAEHRSINSCLRPVCSLGGLSITTIEGTGTVGSPKVEFMNFAPTFSRGGGTHLKAEPSPEWIETYEKLQVFREKKKAEARKILEAKGHTHQVRLKSQPAPTQKTEDQHEGMNPVAHRLAINNGTQCGYCTTGFVMNMSAFLAAKPKPTKQEIEDIFDGNICRCTGYRAILTGMKTFACDLTKEDKANRMDCVTEDKCKQITATPHIHIPFPKDAEQLPTPTTIDAGSKSWHTPQTIEELRQIYQQHDSQQIRMVFGNTSFGIYAPEVEAASTYVDIKLLKELHGIQRVGDVIELGSLTTYSELLEFFRSDLPESSIADHTRWGAIDFMARRTAGMIVRNAGSIGGNTMLVLKHFNESDPFPSDLFTALAGTEAEIEFLEISSGERYRKNIQGIVDYIKEYPESAHDILLIRYFLPQGAKNEVSLAQKVALRQVNSHSIVNATTRFVLGDDGAIENADLAYGGIAPYPWHPTDTEALLKGKALSMDLFQQVVAQLRKEVAGELKNHRARMAKVYSEGFTEEYKIQLAISFLYKAIVHALLQVAPDQVPASVASSGKVSWGNWGVTKGTQDWEHQNWRKPVAQPLIKLMAFYQAMGEVHYTHEIELPPLGKNSAFIQSQRAWADYHFRIPDGPEPASVNEVRLHLAEQFSGFYELLTYADIPAGGHNLQGMGGDQPLFAVDRVSYVGQVIAMIIADTEQEAIAIGEYASKYCVGYRPIRLSSKQWSGEWKEPILSIDQAIRMGSIFPDAPKSSNIATHIWKITRPGTQLDWVNTERDNLDKEPCQRSTKVDNNEVYVVENTQVSGCQIHFYMETQSCVAYPEDGDRLIMHPSSQSPNAMHQTAALSIGAEQNKVEVAIRQLGGGYGGKTEQTRFVAGPTAVAAKVLNIPIRIAMKREHDTAMIGKRHAYYGTYQVAVDSGESNPDNRGIIRGFNLKLWGDGGAFYDCSFVVSNCIQLRIDNAYNIRNFESQLDVCRTNKAPNTAMRAFGDIQGKVIMENAIDDAAYSVGMDPFELRLKNMYRQGDVTPFGQNLAYCYMRDVWEYCKEKSQYDKKKDDVEAFNKKNKWTKRGVYMVPVKYGSGYNLVMIEQATAMVSIYSADGSVMINQGAVDMGQGAITQIEQVASYILNVPMTMIQVLSARTSVIPNPTSTGGSTGTAYNGEAVKQACEVMRARLLEFGQKLLREKGQDWCVEQGVNYWDYETGWATEVTKPKAKHSTLIWQNLVSLAYQYRVELVSTFNAKIRGGTVPVPVMTFKSPDEQPEIPFVENSNPTVISGEVDSFNGFTFSAACAMVEVDVLTGETKILSADLVYDMGYSLNPAIDIGQVEGAFIQGVGYVMTEKLVFESDGPEQGRLNTLNTWRYKPPAITTIPLELNTYLYPRSNSSEIPENPNGLLSAKEVGEPPLVLASSVFFAIKDAIRASRTERDLPGFFRLDAPATVQEVRRVLEVREKDY